MSTLEVARHVWVKCLRRTEIATTVAPVDVPRAANTPVWRRAEFLAGRRTLRALLADTVPAAAGSEIRSRRTGQPTLAGHPDIGISVSHDGGMVAAAVAIGGPVGVDVQVPGDRPSPRMLARCLSRYAAETGAWCPARQIAELAWTWTTQEACVKAAGSGLAGSPWTIDVPPGTVSGRWGDYIWRQIRDSDTPLSCAYAISETERFPV